MRRSSRVLIAGLLFAVLGAGNWIMGADRSERYERRMAAAVARAGPSARIAFAGTATILEDYTAARELYAESLGKYEYYRIVHRGGVLLVVVGLVLVTGAILRRIIVPSARRT